MTLVTAVWETGTIPQQLGWIIVVLILKGGGDYRGLGLLEPIWKIIERVINLLDGLRWGGRYLWFYCFLFLWRHFCGDNFLG